MVGLRFSIEETSRSSNIPTAGVDARPARFNHHTPDSILCLPLCELIFPVLKFHVEFISKIHY